MRKFRLPLIVISLIWFSCSKDAITPEPLPELYPVQTSSLIGTWKLTKTYQQFYDIDLLVYETTRTDFKPNPFRIQFTKELFQNTQNSKKYYDTSTGLTEGIVTWNDVPIQGNWSVFHKDSVTIGQYNFFLKRVTTTEAELIRTANFNASGYTKITATWFFEKVIQ